MTQDASAAAGGARAALVIDAADPAGPAARALIAELDAYQEALYPAESNHLVPVEALRAANVEFLLAWLDGRPAGCGAMVVHGAGPGAPAYGELKRMYVSPPLRGRGIGAALLQRLLVQARRRGIALLRLETGIRQPEALALYERAGFRRRGPFGDYREDPLSLFLELELR